MVSTQISAFASPTVTDIGTKSLISVHESKIPNTNEVSYNENTYNTVPVDLDNQIVKTKDSEKKQ